ncbi:FMN-binding protein [Microbacterium sp. 18062]|uniref:FMN-binding protein n=1 Tax=Microbacterium sp. 18062 TaxID=2681410 RepID=UPI00135BF1A3|nr:FMN-binding protein [Microbacterium sp. 18062]
MIRANAVPRPVRTAVVLVGVAGMVALAGCATDTTAAEESTSTPTTGSSAAESATDDSTASSSASTTYADGTYTAEGSYQTPESVESITVTLTLEDDVITAVDVTGDPQARESQQYQSQFIGGIAEVVVGQDIDDIDVSRVAGSSLTSGGFNEAVEEIKSEAAL